MGKTELLVLMIAVLGLTTGRRMFKKCTFCRYFFDTGSSPYELLWVLREEIASYLSEDQRITLFLDEDDLIKAELVFELYCERTCFRNRVSDSAAPPETEMSVFNRPQKAFKAFNEACGGNAVPVGDYGRIPPQKSEIRTLFGGPKVASSGVMSLARASAGQPAEQDPGSPTPFEASNDMSEGVAVGHQREEFRAMFAASSAASANEEEEEEIPAGLKRAPNEAFDWHPGEYGITDISEMDGWSLENSAPDEVTSGTFSDSSGEGVNDSEELWSGEIQHSIISESDTVDDYAAGDGSVRLELPFLR